MLYNERLKDVITIVEEKNPLLLNEIYKGASGGMMMNSKHYQ
jgi:hypothetical protein